jgi:hypothetical protein
MSPVRVIAIARASLEGCLQRRHIDSMNIMINGRLKVQVLEGRIGFWVIPLARETKASYWRAVMKLMMIWTAIVARWMILEAIVTVTKQRIRD